MAGKTLARLARAAHGISTVVLAVKAVSRNLMNESENLNDFGAFVVAERPAGGILHRQPDISRKNLAPSAQRMIDSIFVTAGRSRFNQRAPVATTAARLRGG